MRLGSFSLSPIEICLPRLGVFALRGVDAPGIEPAWYGLEGTGPHELPATPVETPLRRAEWLLRHQRAPGPFKGH